jgi:hypothetical protein
MIHKSITTVLALAAMLSLPAAARAQGTTTRTNRRGATITDTRSVQGGQYTNHKTVTTAQGKTYSKSKSQSVGPHGRILTTNTRTGPNGKSTSRVTAHGRYGNMTTVAGPNGGSRTFVRRKP